MGRLEAIWSKHGKSKVGVEPMAPDGRALKDQANQSRLMRDHR